MNCRRCQGLMISDQLYHHNEALYVLSIWRCLNCGETFDPMIVQNRTNQERKDGGERPRSTKWADTRSPLAITR
jgi:hypothetical protein